jgi:hypothetical protein
MGLRGLFGFGKPKLAVQVLGEAIIVTFPGTSFTVTYKRWNGGLVAADFSGKDMQRKNHDAGIPIARVERRECQGERAKMDCLAFRSGSDSLVGEWSIVGRHTPVKYRSRC